MKIIIAGDTHGRFSELFKLEDMDPDLILQCGDFGYWPKINACQRAMAFFFLGMPCHFVDGNHEDHRALAELRGADPKPRAHEIKENVIWQDRGSTLTLPDGRTVLFAGGAFSVDWSVRTDGLDWFQAEEILTERDFARFSGGKVDIVVSHTCPGRLTAPILGDMARWEQPDPSRAVLDKVWDRYRPSMWFFGHWHTRISGLLDGCEWHALAPLDGSSPLKDGIFVME